MSTYIYVTWYGKETICQNTLIAQLITDKYSFSKTNLSENASEVVIRSASESSMIIANMHYNVYRAFYICSYHVGKTPNQLLGMSNLNGRATSNYRQIFGSSITEIAKIHITRINCTMANLFPITF